MDPSSHRLTTRALAKHTGGRVLSVRYRLAPQQPFPSALLDALHAYLYLIAPPPDALHEPIKPQHIVFAGDSAGAGLSTSLLLLLLQLQRTATSSSTPQYLQFHSTSIPLTPSLLPAGIALNSPYVDVTHALPSILTNAHYDYLFIPPPPTTATSSSSSNDTSQLAPPETAFQPPPDAHWPTSPPRADLYAPTARLMAHPLVSPVMSLPRHWDGAPSVWMCVGEEMLLDSGEALARTISRSDGGKGKVQFLGWEGMPHCFAMLFPKSASGRGCVRRWAGFMVDVTQGDGREEVRSYAYWYKPRQNVAQERYEVAFEELLDVSDEEVRRLVKEASRRAAKREEEAVKKWEAEGGKARL